MPLHTTLAFHTLCPRIVSWDKTTLHREKVTDMFSDIIKM